MDAADMFHTAGTFMFVADAVISGYEGYSDLRNHDYVGAAKSGLDITMGAVGLVGPIGFVVSSTYFLTDKFIGWNNVVKAMEETTQQEEDIAEEETGFGMGY